jgi:hypothetical protein
MPFFFSWASGFGWRCIRALVQDKPQTFPRLPPPISCRIYFFVFFLLLWRMRVACSSASSFFALSCVQVYLLHGCHQGGGWKPFAVKRGFDILPPTCGGSCYFCRPKHLRMYAAHICMLLPSRSYMYTIRALKPDKLLFFPSFLLLYLPVAALDPSADIPFPFLL